MGMFVCSAAVWFKRRWFMLLSVALVMSVLAVTGISIQDRDNVAKSQFTLGVGNSGKVITLGDTSLAAGSVDYTFDGVDDNVQFQAALNALPATGGNLVVVSATTINFSATVTRAINNVTVTGTGMGTAFANDGLTALFTAGGNNWKFADLSTDAGGLTMGATTGWQWLNVNDGSGTVYDFRTPAGSIVNGAYTASSLTDSGLTNGRIPIAGVAGLLGDSANLTWDGSADTDAATLSDLGVLGASAWVVANDAPAAIKTYATTLQAAGYPVWVCDGTADDVEIQAAIDSLQTTGGSVHLTAGTYALANGLIIVATSHTRSLLIEGYGARLNYNKASGVAIALQLNHSGGTFAYEKTFTLRGFTLNGNAGASDGILLDRMQKAVLDDLLIQNFTEPSTGRAIRIIDSGGDSSEYNVIQNTLIYNNTIGIQNSVTNSAANTRIQNVAIVLKAATFTYGIYSSSPLVRSQLTNVIVHMGNADNQFAYYFNGSVEGTVLSSCAIDDHGSVALGQIGIWGDTSSSGDLLALNQQNSSTNPNFTPYYITGTMNIRFMHGTNIAPSEIRTASGVLTAGVANAIAFAWHNPEAQDILVRKVVVEVITGGGTVGSHLDVGIADDAAGTNRGLEFFNDLLLNNAQVDDSWVAGDGGTQTKWVLCQDSVSATDGWVVGQILDANAASLVGKYYIEYSGR